MLGIEWVCHLIINLFYHLPNRRTDTGGKDSLISRVADGMLFGRATCSNCPSGSSNDCQLKFSNGIYKCTTELQWGLCGWEGTSVLIHPWKFTDQLLQHQVIRNLPKEPQKRPLVKAIKDLTKYRRDPKQPLRGMKFALAGRLVKPHQDMKEYILSHAGSFSEEITSDVDYVISTYGEVLSGRPKIRKATDLNLAVVSSLLVERLVSEFGFDQSEYLLCGSLPEIAKLKLDPASETKQVTTSDTSGGDFLPRKGTLHAEARCPRGRIHKDNQGVVYDVVMSMTDLHDGSNKYYILQMIDVDCRSKVFIVFRKWGRVGTTIGGTKRSGPLGFHPALQEFKEVYFDRTGNKWEDRKTGEKKAGKYFPLELVDESDEKDPPNLSKEVLQLPSYLDPRVKEVVDLIFDVDMMNRELKDLEVDVRKMPLGKFSQTQLIRGYQVLREIEEVIQSHEENKEFKLVNLSNQFYTIIPTDFGKKLVQRIDTFEILNSKLKQMEALIDVQVASSLLTEELVDNLNPSDNNYKKLGVVLKPLSEYSREFKQIRRYIENGYDPTKLGYKIILEVVFSVSRPGEINQFQPFREVRPRKLLWHGSRLCNYVGILNQGLRIAPPEAPTSGYLFGKGIYFADRIQKSAPYCYPTKENPVGLLLLADVALGEALEVKKPTFITSLPEGKSSTLVLAKTVPDPSKEEIGDERVIIPTGMGIPSGQNDVFLEDQEYVIYQRQLLTKYLVKIRFDFLQK
eukprot:TRINITY_DN2767_c0_g1_i3.p1 TRINITY_DN2767_c0_g1~~TRINITY_DN2767_c0_g1_i3.p1  ORF type:complete len:739 (-),score=170.05 TRINITY_DN2767_c0_g1_i3:252-2468(-)